MKTRSSFSLFLVTLMFGSSLNLLGGCASSGIGAIPPVTQKPTGSDKVGKFVWFDLITDDVEAAKRFYGGLFGWRFEASDHADYTVVKHDAKPIAGIAGIAAVDPIRDKKPGGRWLASLSVENVANAVEMVRAKGGTIHEGPDRIPDRGEMAIVSDPQGAQFVLLRSVSGDPPDAHPSLGEWMWIELWTRDDNAAIGFYQSLVAYDHEVVDNGFGQHYSLLKRDGVSRAGVVHLPWKDVHPTWAPYVRVADPAAIAKKAQALGGRVFMEPTPEFENGTIAIIVDPTGGVVIVQKWSGMAIKQEL